MRVPGIFAGAFALPPLASVPRYRAADHNARRNAEQACQKQECGGIASPLVVMHGSFFSSIVIIILVIAYRLLTGHCGAVRIWMTPFKDNAQKSIQQATHRKYNRYDNQNDDVFVHRVSPLRI